MSPVRIALVVAAVLPALAGALRAHEIRPAYLQIRQTDAETYDVLWKVPARAGARLPIDARLPPSCAELRPPTSRDLGDAVVERWAVVCRGGLGGATIRVDGLSASPARVLLRLERSDGTTRTALLGPDEPSLVVAAAARRSTIVRSYLQLGIEHILLGIDHLLFVLALLILVEGRRRLVGTVTAFTVAHSLTLAAATLGLAEVPQQPVEAVIALSIVFVAAEIVHLHQDRPGIAQRWPWIVAFTFGLLHGFGFAGALTAVGLPERAIPLALLFFNVGVEVGQLIFIAVVFAGVALARRLRIPRPTWAWRIPAYGIGALATCWTLQRVIGFWR